MADCIKEELWAVIDEMNTAYVQVSDYEALNADYAEYAHLAIGRFREILKNPALTRDELQDLLRSGLANHKRDGQSSDWRQFVASYMAQSANSDILEGVEGYA